ncbi:MAG: hypothetical protein DIZ77_01795 [endosymbiont of Seepiophila jonesi]|uniref:Uncharacterized protein n=1 Tax=endosymbiont of Lamellibrachia luymesi TaxID=2200907 RepID=A0A370DUC8_9GAMM|nr:MAG: hypothetical protein DIZ79_14145 [endosymbiont of Lamellibrachia luymesi]RDH94319.1 MAG: hypothetical protein DIZ77_01795 [endosymbiont of Seepiophila jonesi]
MITKFMAKREIGTFQFRNQIPLHPECLRTMSLPSSRLSRPKQLQKTVFILFIPDGQAFDHRQEAFKLISE